MSESEKLLRRIVETEEAAMDHNESCDICRVSRGRAPCVQAIQMAKDSIEAMTRAKMWLDRQRAPRAVRAKRAQTATLMSFAAFAGVLMDRLVS